jgi:membrane-associated phospholipid phosphatase
MANIREEIFWGILFLTIAVIAGEIVPHFLPQVINPHSFAGQEVLFLQEHLTSPITDWLTVIVYISAYPILVYGTALFLLAKRKIYDFNNYLLVFIIVVSLGIVTWAIYPVAPPRIAVNGVRQIRESIAGFTETFNPFVNGAFPSLHAATGLTAILFARKYSKKVSVGWIILFVLMIFSVLYLGEHYWQDVLVGCLYSIAAYFLVMRLRSKTYIKP